MWSMKIQATLEASADTLAAKGMEVDPTMPVHPTFLYESVWCLLGFLILNYVVHKHRKFKGEIFMLYGVWYGLERAVVEGLRTDSLYIGDTTLRVSQLLSMVIVVVFAIALIVCFVKLKKGTLWKGLRLECVNVTDCENQQQESIVAAVNNNDDMEKENGTDN